MEMTIVITVLCISLSLLLTPACTASLKIHHVQLQKPQENVNNEVPGDHLSQLARKLIFTAEVTVKKHGGQDTTTENYKLNEDVPTAGTSLFHKDQGLKHGIGSNKKGSAGTWQQWVEGGDTSQYFTMDYSHVKRRRPIHNKSLPVAP